MFSQEKFRQKIRDYLLFLISSGTDKKDIQKKCEWSERRLARFLSGYEISDKQLSITLKDLYNLSKLEEDCSLEQFISQLSSDSGQTTGSLTGWQKKCLTIFDALTQNERQNLLKSILHEKSDTQKLVSLFQMISHMVDLPQFELETISRVIKSIAA